MVQGRMRKINYKSKKNIRLPKEEWKIVKNTHEPLIDLKLFQKANDMLALRKQTRIKSHDYLLKGLVYCHECRKKMNCSSRHLTTGVKYYFRCTTYLRNTNSCTSHSLRMDYVEKEITNLLHDFIRDYFNPNTFERITKKFYFKYFQLNNQIELISNYQKKFTTLSLQIDQLYNDKLCGIIDNTDFNRIYTAKKKMQTELNKKILLLKSSDYSSIQNKIKNIKEDFLNKISIDRKILTEFIEKIEIDSSKKIYVYLKFRTIY